MKTDKLYLVGFMGAGKTTVARALGRRKRFGLAEAVRRLGMEFEGSHHRGIDDARNIARVVRRVWLAAAAEADGAVDA